MPGSVDIEQMYFGASLHVAVSEKSQCFVLGFLSQLGALFTFNPNPDGKRDMLSVR